MFPSQALFKAPTGEAQDPGGAAIRGDGQVTCEDAVVLALKAQVHHSVHRCYGNSSSNSSNRMSMIPPFGIYGGLRLMIAGIRVTAIM